MEAVEEFFPFCAMLIMITDILSFFTEHVVIHIHKNMQLSLWYFSYSM
jgi:hypothetical protein